MAKLKAKQLRQSLPLPQSLDKIKRSPLYLIVEEVWDTYNIGSLFRLADALAMEKVYLCGPMEVPPNTKIKKAAIGTDNWVPWEQAKTATAVIKKLKKRGIKIIAIEQGVNSVPYYDYHYDWPLALVVGNETAGIKNQTLTQCDAIVELPMFGINHSFNVWGSAAVVAYQAALGLKNIN